MPMIPEFLEFIFGVSDPLISGKFEIRKEIVGQAGTACRRLFCLPIGFQDSGFRIQESGFRIQ